MTTFEIIEARAHHCGQIIRSLRDDHRACIDQLGQDAHRALRTCFDASSFRRAWLVDGRLSAVWGVSGSMISPEGYGWLALTNAATSHPIAVIREARRQIDEIMIVKRRLVTTVIGNDKAARRFAAAIGFVVDGDGILSIRHNST